MNHRKTVIDASLVPCSPQSSGGPMIVFSMPWWLVWMREPRLRYAAIFSVLLVMSLFCATCMSCCGGLGGEDSEEQRTSSVKPFTENILSVVTIQYNADVSRHASWARRCMEYWPLFEKASKLSGYPPAFIAGVASHESVGCQAHKSDWAGGKGFMQITSRPSRAYVRRVAAMLEIDPSSVDWRNNNLHNILMGTVFLADYESQLLSRPHGLLAYNMGVGGVRGKVRRMGRNMKKPPTLLEMAPHLTYNKKMKPRVYVWRVLSHVILMDRASQGLPLTQVEDDFTASDIPGWDPENDLR